MTTAGETTPDRAPKARKRRKARGVGNVRLRGETWWIDYFVNGRRFRESSESPNRGDAVELLRRRLAECGKGRRVNPTEEARVTMAELFASLETDYRINGRRSADTLGWRLKHLREAFENDRAHNVTEPRIALYVERRLQAEAAPATINRELAALRRAFKLAVRQRRLSGAPTFDMLAEHNARQGFIDPGDFEAVVARLPDYLQDAARFAYATGWRRGEVASLEWADVDRAGRRITLRAEHSKNEDPRMLPLTPDLAALVERRWDAREYRLANGAAGVSRFVFHRGGRAPRRLPQELGDRVQGGRPGQPALPRHAALGRAQLRPGRHRGRRRYADHRAPDGQRLPALSHRERGGHAGRAAQDRGGHEGRNGAHGRPPPERHPCVTGTRPSQTTKGAAHHRAPSV